MLHKSVLFCVEKTKVLVNFVMLFRRAEANRLIIIHAFIKSFINHLKFVSGTGTFGRVCLCRDKAADEYLAMKILSMADVIRLKQVDHVMNEKNILAEINHPFIVNL